MSHNLAHEVRGNLHMHKEIPGSNSSHKKPGGKKGRDAVPFLWEPYFQAFVLGEN